MDTLRKKVEIQRVLLDYRYRIEALANEAKGFRYENGAEYEKARNEYLTAQYESLKLSSRLKPIVLTHPEMATVLTIINHNPSRMIFHFPQQTVWNFYNKEGWLDIVRASDICLEGLFRTGILFHSRQEIELPSGNKMSATVRLLLKGIRVVLVKEKKYITT